MAFEDLRPVPIADGVNLYVKASPEGEMCEVSAVTLALGIDRAQFIEQVKAEHRIWHSEDPVNRWFFILRSDLIYLGQLQDLRRVRSDYGLNLIRKLKEFSRGAIAREQAALDSKDPVMLLSRAAQDIRAEQLAQGKRLAALSQRVETIEAGVTRTDWRADLELMLRDPGIPDRQKVNAVVRQVARRDEKSQQQLWDRIYYRLRYERNFDAYARAKPRRNGRYSGEPLDAVQQAGLMPALLQIARRVLLDGRAD